MSIAVELPALGESVVEGTVSRWLVKEGDPRRGRPAPRRGHDRQGRRRDPGSGRRASSRRCWRLRADVVLVGAELATHRGAVRTPGGHVVPGLPRVDCPRAFAARRRGFAGPGRPPSPARLRRPGRRLPARDPGQRQRGPGHQVRRPLARRTAGDRRGRARRGGLGLGRVVPGAGRAHTVAPAAPPSSWRRATAVVPMSTAAPAGRRAHGLLEAHESPRGHRRGGRSGGVVRVRKRHSAPSRSVMARALTVLPFVAHCVARALREFPALNVSVAGDAIVERHGFHLGVRGGDREGAAWRPWCAMPIGSRSPVWRSRLPTSPAARARASSVRTSCAAGRSPSRTPGVPGICTASRSSTSPRWASCGWGSW